MTIRKINVLTGEVTTVQGDAPSFAQAPTVADVKAEAMSRILALAPEWKQRNLTAQAAILAKKGEANWTTEEQAAWDAGEALWTQIAAIRAASDVLEALEPIPNPATWDGWP
jgi:delta 1-pyrroline-5-carboxylate dehydrogenase